MIIFRIAAFLGLILVLVNAARSQTSNRPDTTGPRSAAGSEGIPCTKLFDTGKYSPLDPGIRPPRAVSTPDPQYPEAARKSKKSGSVILALAINEEGSIDDVTVFRASDKMFEQNAMDAARQWKFAPATRDGKPMAVQLCVEMAFRLR